MARTLARATGLPTFHLDREYWLPGWVEPDPASWSARVDELIAGERWIIDGNYSDSLERRLGRADTVVFLDLPRWRCVLAAFMRSLKRRTRPDMAPGCEEHISPSFLLYVWRFKRDKRPKVLRLVEQRRNWQLITVRSRREARDLAERLSRSSRSSP